ncbi:hypothetical protein KIN20_027004 [Parelaphostrongylus tenuis]|uniref:Uncharacterized protein n=1 Tax=Parelaphostrongylus tenuis TaxID=148309 RepID=A0AAD5WDD9_PARTN|nr:hypothetical protein KIN20_027004 [Parelaphostrongylus tenuis]
MNSGVVHTESYCSFLNGANSLLTQLELMSRMYDSDVILMMLGDDFRFDMIDEWHQHYDNFLPLFEEINSGHRAKIRSVAERALDALICH